MGWLSKLRVWAAIKLWPYDGPVDDQPGSDVVRYFISYCYSHTEYHNGGNKRFGTGMATMDVVDGITDFSNVTHIASNIEAECAKGGVINPEVTILGLVPIKSYHVEKGVI